MKQYELVIFDWDGTLMDTIGKIVCSMQQAALSLDIPMPSEQAVRDIIGLSLAEAIEGLYPQSSPEFVAELRNAYKIQYLELNHMPCPVFDGAEQLLSTLSEQGYTLAVATGKARSGLDRMLQETGFGQYFVASRTADEAKSKPHPDMLLQLLAEFEVSADKALMIGDSLLDLTMANNAGIDAIGVDYGAHSNEKLRQASPKAVISSPFELLRVLGH